MCLFIAGVYVIKIRIQIELRKFVGLELITTVIRSGRLGYYGHVMKKDNEDWVKNCMEIRVEGRRSVGILRET